MNRTFRSAVIATIATFALATASFAAPAKPKAAIGTLQKVDGQNLTIQTAKGPETVMLAPNAKITSRAKTVAAADLPSHVGDRVKVRYSEVSGHNEASSVTLSSRSTRQASASTPKHTRANRKS
jgi:hypothetical protein